MAIPERIVVTEDQLGAGAATLLRYALTTIGGILVTNGFLPAGSDVNAIAGALLIVISTGYGMWKTYSNKKKLIVTAAAAPDSVAVVK